MNFTRFFVVYEFLSQSLPIFPRYVCINNTITHYRSLSYTKLVLVLIVVITFPTCIGSYLIQPPPIQPQSTPAMLNSDVLSRVRKGKVKIPFPSSLQEVPNWLHLHLIDHFCTVAQSSHDTQRTDLAKKRPKNTIRSFPNSPVVHLSGKKLPPNTKHRISTHS